MECRSMTCVEIIKYVLVCPLGFPCLPHLLKILSSSMSIPQYKQLNESSATDGLPNVSFCMFWYATIPSELLVDIGVNDNVIYLYF